MPLSEYIILMIEKERSWYTWTGNWGKYEIEIEINIKFETSKYSLISHSIYHLDFPSPFLSATVFEGVCCCLRELNRVFSGLFWPKYRRLQKCWQNSWLRPRQIKVYAVWRSYSPSHKTPFSFRSGLIYLQRLFYQHFRGHT